jgi:hypothetical protein
LKKLLAQLIAPLLMFAFQQPLPAQEAAAPAELAVIDLRPQEEKDGIGLLPLTGKCNKDVFRIADVATDPLKVEVLKSELWERLSTDDAAKTFTVLNWSIYYNKQVQKSGGGLLQSVGIQGYDVPAKEKSKKPGSICSARESAGGWYKGDEVTSVYFPLISEFTGTFGGKPLTVRVVHSPTRKIEGKFAGGPGDTAELLATVHETADALATVMAR